MKKLFLALLALTSSAWAAPTITTFDGVAADGDTITIRGNNFGTNALWFSFLGGASGVTNSESLLAIHAHIDDLHAIGKQGWQTGSNFGGNHCTTDSVFITRLRNTIVRANRISSISTAQRDPAENINSFCYTNPFGFYPSSKSFGTGNRNVPWWTAGTDTMDVPEVYASWWEYDDARSFLDWGASFKHVSIWSGSTAPGAPMYYIIPGGIWLASMYDSLSSEIPYRGELGFESRCGCNSAQCAYCTFNSNQQCDWGDIWCHLYPTGSSPGQYQARGKWVRWEVWVKANTATGNRDDAQIFYSFQAPGRSRVYLYSRDGICRTTTHAEEYEPYWQIGCPGGGIPPSRTWNKFAMFAFTGFSQRIKTRRQYFDDIYLSDTRARVMLGNAPTYAACTQFEIQPPVTWTTDSLQVQLNYGTLTGPKYLYVIDENDDYSNGVVVPEAVRVRAVVR